MIKNRMQTMKRTTNMDGKTMANSKLKLCGAFLVLGLATWTILGLYGVSAAAPEQRRPQTVPAKPPFNNSVKQRMDMVAELREIKELLRVQNEILRDLAKQKKNAEAK